MKKLLIISVFILASVAQAQFPGISEIEARRSRATITTVHNDTVRATTDTTAWYQLVPDNYERYPINWEDHRYWTLFCKIDSLKTVTATIANVSVSFEVALRDTTVPYTAYDGTSNVFTLSDTLQVYEKLNLYGGYKVRFLVTAVDSAQVKLDLWQKH